MSQAAAADLPGTPLGLGSTAEVRRLDAERVLKLFKPHISPDQIATETDALARAAAGGIPVPRFHQTADYGPRRGIILDAINGSSVLTRLTRSPFAVPRLLQRMAALQAQIHRLPGDGLPAQADAIRTAIARADLPNDLHALVTARLDQAHGALALCHGDFHAGNLIDRAGVLYIIDWDKARAGSPAADTARTAVMLRDGQLGGIGDSALADPVRKALADAYIRAYAATRATRTDARQVAAEVRWWLPVITAAKLPFVAPSRRARVLRRLRRDLG
jgi:aminoglycoside phosphotransferase (APT) family kinase protein